MDVGGNVDLNYSTGEYTCYFPNKPDNLSKLSFQKVQSSFGSRQIRDLRNTASFKRVIESGRTIKVIVGNKDIGSEESQVEVRAVYVQKLFGKSGSKDSTPTAWKEELVVDHIEIPIKTDGSDKELAQHKETKRLVKPGNHDANPLPDRISVTAIAALSSVVVLPVLMCLGMLLMKCSVAVYYIDD